MGYGHANLMKSFNNFVIPGSKIVSKIQTNIYAFTEKYRLILTDSLVVTSNIFCDFQA